MAEQACWTRGAVCPTGEYFSRVLERTHPGDASWYLQALGVHPRAQRRGIGRQLMVPVLALADESGSACHLHTSDPANIAYYQRFGFDVRQPAIRVFPNGPDYVGMTRLPGGQGPGRTGVTG